MPAVRDFLAVSGGPLATREGTSFFAAFVGCLVLLAAASMYLFPHVIDGDAVGYESAVRVFAGGEAPYIPAGIPEHTLDVVTVHRILMTPLSVGSLFIFSEIFGSLIGGWLVWDTLFFLGSSVVMYLLLRRFFQSDIVAIFGGLFFAGNYAMVTSGLGMFVDIAAWFFYLLALYLVYHYLLVGGYRHLVFAAIVVSIGGLFKENAYTALAAIGIILLFREWRTPIRFLVHALPLGLIVALPAVVHHTSIYMQYGYTYLYWIHLAENVYTYNSLVAEYIKNLGSLLTLLAPLSLVGGILFLRPRWSPFVSGDQRVYAAAVAVSAVPALLWPALEQRVMFLIVPALLLFAGIVLKKYERYWYAFVPVVTLYILSGFLMDAYILDLVNLPF